MMKAPNISLKTKGGGMFSVIEPGLVVNLQDFEITSQCHNCGLQAVTCGRKKTWTQQRMRILMMSTRWMENSQQTTIIRLISVRDKTLSRIKSNIELMVATNEWNKVVVVQHSMGVLIQFYWLCG